MGVSGGKERVEEKITGRAESKKLRGQSIGRIIYVDTEIIPFYRRTSFGEIDRS